MGNVTQGELDSRRGVVKFNNLTGQEIQLIITATVATIVSRKTSSSVGVSVNGRGNGGKAPGGGGGAGVNVSNSEEVEYFINQVYSHVVIGIRPHSEFSQTWDTGKGISRYEGVSKDEKFFVTVFIGGKPRLINHCFRGGNVVSFASDGNITRRHEMKFDGKNEHQTVAQWNVIADVSLVQSLPEKYVGLKEIKS